MQRLPPLERINRWRERPMQTLKCNYCGSPIPNSEVWAFLHYLIKKKYYVQCPKCRHISNYHIRLWLVHDTTDRTEKELNKKQRWWNMTETKKVLLKDLVEQARKEYGSPHLRHSPTMDTIQKIPDNYWKEHHDQGKTLKQVAEEVNVSPVYLSQCLTRKGIYWRQLWWMADTNMTYRTG